MASSFAYDLQGHFGAGYMFHNEFSKYSSDSSSTSYYYSLLHGATVDLSLHGYADEFTNIGFCYNLDILYPSALYNKIDNSRELNLTLSNCGLTGFSMVNAAGVQFRYEFDYENYIEWSVSGKIGIDYIVYKLSSNSETSKVFDMRLGLQTRVNYTHFFTEKIGINAGILLDYDFLSLAQLVNPENYSLFQGLEIMPTCSCVVKF